jgi:hypothetical protein
MGLFSLLFVGVFFSSLTCVSKSAKRINFRRPSHTKPRPLGQNGYESWYGTGASVGHFYVVKHVKLVLPRYVSGYKRAGALQISHVQENSGVMMKGLNRSEEGRKM